jgi:hypothetical protein
LRAFLGVKPAGTQARLVVEHKGLFNSRRIFGTDLIHFQ